MKTPKYKPVLKMPKAGLEDWKEWAEDKILEYQKFIAKLENELNRG